MQLPTRNDMIDVVVGVMSVPKDHFRSLILVDTKEDGTTVSTVDKQINDRLLEWSRRYQDVGFIGEEGNDYHGEDYILCADPLDGSDAFAGGNGNVGIALTRLCRIAHNLWLPEITVVADPLHNMVWTASQDEQTVVARLDRGQMTRQQCQTTDRSPRRVTISTWPGVPFHLDEVQREVMRRRAQYFQQEFGCILIPSALVASGLWQATAFAGSGATESIATSLLVRQAGGVIVDCNGRLLTLFKLGERYGKLDFILENGAIMAANQSVADDLVEIIHSKQAA